MDPSVVFPIKLHIHNSTDLGPVFQVTKERWRGSLKNFREIEQKLVVTFSEDDEELDKYLPQADVLFCWDFDKKDFKKRAPNLKWIHIHGAGVSHLRPFDWLSEGIILTNSRGVHGERAAEYVMMAVLMLNNRIPEMVNNQMDSNWEQLFNTSVVGKTLLIFGVGSVGGSAAKLAKQFEMTVLGIRRSGAGADCVDAMHKPGELKRLLPEADFVLITAPYTTETDQIFGAVEIDLLKSGAGLINYSRAGLVDYNALQKRLIKREITAVLDVFDPEPLPQDSTLWSTPNLIITPHCSSDDRELYTPKTLDLVLSNLSNWINGKEIINRVNIEREY